MILELNLVLKNWSTLREKRYLLYNQTSIYASSLNAVVMLFSTKKAWKKIK